MQKFAYIRPISQRTSQSPGQSGSSGQSGSRVTPIRVGSGHGSVSLTRFQLCSIACAFSTIGSHKHCVKRTAVNYFAIRRQEININVVCLFGLSYIYYTKRTSVASSRHVAAQCIHSCERPDAPSVETRRTQQQQQQQQPNQVSHTEREARSFYPALISRGKAPSQKLRSTSHLLQLSFPGDSFITKSMFCKPPDSCWSRQHDGSLCHRYTRLCEIIRSWRHTFGHISHT